MGTTITIILVCAVAIILDVKDGDLDNKAELCGVKFRIIPKAKTNPDGSHTFEWWIEPGHRRRLQESCDAPPTFEVEIGDDTALGKCHDDSTCKQLLDEYDVTSNQTPDERCTALEITCSDAEKELFASAIEDMKAIKELMDSTIESEDCNQDKEDQLCQC